MGLFRGVVGVWGLEWLLGGGMIGGSGGSNIVDKLFVVYEGNEEFMILSNGSLLLRFDLICRKMDIV